LNTPLRPALTACLLAGVTLLSYGYQLSSAPLDADERLVLEQAQRGGGPLFFDAGDGRWLMPLPVYATAIVRPLAPPEIPGRVVAVIAAAVNVLLLFYCARLVFMNDFAALFAAALLMITPAHVAFGRHGAGALLSVPFVLLATLAMLKHLQSDRAFAVAASGAALGAGIYTGQSGPLTMTFLCLLFLATLIVWRRKWTSALLLSGCFAAMLAPAAVWFALHPDTYRDTFGRWAIHLAHVRNPLDGVAAFLNWNTLGNRASLYWGFLDPAWLFFGEPLRLMALVFLILGLAGWRRVISAQTMVVIAGGALVSPLAGSSFGQPHYLSDALPFLPFIALLSTAGVMYLWKRFAGTATAV
jgi:4-amino-4-deoxy-L-arabinose transferase-like glycosyltransferase